MDTSRFGASFIIHRGNQRGRHFLHKIICRKELNPTKNIISVQFISVIPPFDSSRVGALLFIGNERLLFLEIDMRVRRGSRRPRTCMRLATRRRETAAEAEDTVDELLEGDENRIPTIVIRKCRD